MNKVLSIILLSALAGCSIATDVANEIGQANKSFMALFGNDATALAKLYSSTGQVLPTGSDAIEGTADIATFWQSVFDSGVAEAVLETLEITELGDTAVEVGRYSLIATDGQIADNGKYIVIWKKENGAWKLHRDIFNSSQAPPQ
jgi:ketosteroid isomerase-like protein